MKNYLKNKWESSYQRNENHLFYPSDEVIKFFSRFIKKRMDIDSFEQKETKNNRILDACCGIGRNLKLGTEIGFKMYGFDLSKNAITFSNKWLVKKLKLIKKSRLSVSSIDELSYKNNFFDHVVCDSALDSMSFEIAVNGISELYRVTKPGALFYCSLISGDDSKFSEVFNKEIIIKESYENETVQSYFDKNKIIRLIEPLFEIISIELHNIIKNDGSIQGRWHVISRRRN